MHPFPTENPLLKVRGPSGMVWDVAHRVVVGGKLEDFQEQPVQTESSFHFHKHVWMQIKPKSFKPIILLYLYFQFIYMLLLQHTPDFKGYLDFTASNTDSGSFGAAQS